MLSKAFHDVLILEHARKLRSSIVVSPRPALARRLLRAESCSAVLSSARGRSTPRFPDELRRILLPVSESVDASTLAFVADLAGYHEAEVLLVHALLSAMGEETPRFTAEPVTRAEADCLLRDARRRLTGVRVRTLVETGPPAKVILRAASASGVDLVVMAWRARHWLYRWIFGSVTETVLGSSPVPVLVHRLGAGPSNGGPG